MGRKLKYDFVNMKVGDSIIGTYTIVSCAINWAKNNDNGWKFRSERSGNDVKLFRTR